MVTYQQFLKSGVDLAPLGMERAEEQIPHFCTPKGAKLIGWAGVDGIHYCFIRGFGECIFAVSPMNTGDYVHPIARNFEDLLRLLLACGDMSALEQCCAWNEEQYKSFLADSPITAEQRSVLDTISREFELTPMDDAFSYVRELQAEFDPSRIPYTRAFYDCLDANSAVTQEIPQWKVYFDGNFWGHSGAQRPGVEIPVGMRFDWAGCRWTIPAVYACGKGLVVDYCMRVEPWLIRSFAERWDLTPENAFQKKVSSEEQMLMELDNPLCLDFNAVVHLNGKDLVSTHGCGISYVPAFSDEEPDGEARWAVEHYRLDPSFAWVIQRSCYPWPTRRRPEIKTLSLTMIQRKVSIPGPCFTVEKSGDSRRFAHPKDGTEYTLTVQEYAPEIMNQDFMGHNELEYPTHYRIMSYTITPAPLDGAITVQDCASSDCPRRKGNTSAREASMIGIIGGADGPTALIHGTHSSELRAACSAVHFEPVEQVQWRVVFHEKQFADKVVALLPKS